MNVRWQVINHVIWTHIPALGIFIWQMFSVVKLRSAVVHVHNYSKLSSILYKKNKRNVNVNILCATYLI